jgi:type VI secretion system protein VasD
MRSPVTLRSLAVLPLLSLAAGCALIPGREAKPPSPLHLRVSAGARLNPDEQGESLPTAVRVYQLRSAAKAERAELAPLLRDPKETLGDDFLAVDEVFVEPRGAAEKTIAREKDARAVVVVAVFRRPSGEAWRDVVELPAGGKRTRLEYVLDEYRIARR